MGEAEMVEEEHTRQNLQRRKVSSLLIVVQGIGRPLDLKEVSCGEVGGRLAHDENQGS
jgi:hypothetical protein